ncbi:glycosyl transferase [Azorhizobium oxalatiphilum]|uniref:Glycosyl transferase n=1 Tax=Azorhizobium oxalatiphilum TaxID=980631 RepID=A0A917BNQ5_9HYPH|nr:glycosyltransferase [Azorhizobium oxalatiphilum]GGF48076.1 glycosyl transferase [Azorhizobium oxalatiphilum]
MISVVIPTKDSERDLVPVLSALVAGVTGGVLREVILVDGASTDETATIADAAGCTFLPSVGDVGVRLKQGAAHTRGRWLLFLGPNAILDEGWPREVSAFLETMERRGGADKAVATFRLSMDGYGFRPRLGEAMAAAKLNVLGLPKPGQGLLISRRHYDRLGGHPPGVSAERRLMARIGRRRVHVLRTRVLLAAPRTDAD